MPGPPSLTLPSIAVQPPHKVNLTNPEKTVIVQLLKSSAALSVAPKHRELMRFNLRELSTTDEEQVKAARAAKEAAAVQANGSTKATAGEETAVAPDEAESGAEEVTVQKPAAEPASDTASAEECKEGELEGKAQNDSAAATAAEEK